MMRPYLILACSATKRHDPGYMGAAKRYDGPAYRVLRASGWPNVYRGPNCRVLILSAEYGLISSYQVIESYDRRMDEARAAELAAMDERKLRKELWLPYIRDRVERHHFGASEVYVWGGALYRQVVEAWQARGIFDHVPGGVRYSQGGIGQQLGQLKAWLHARRPAQAAA